MLHKQLELSYGGSLETFLLDPKISRDVIKKRPALIICPGGAYMTLATKESEPCAVTFMEKGYHCFILYYAVAQSQSDTNMNENARYPIPVLQLMEAVHKIKQHANSWYIDSDMIFLMGFSAGGHVCASMGTRWWDSALLERLSFTCKKDELRVAGMVLGYPMLKDQEQEFMKRHEHQLPERPIVHLNEVLYGTKHPTQEQKEDVNLISYVDKHTIPTFLWHSIDDPVIDPNESTKFIERLMKYHIVCEYHLFGHGEHGKSLASELIAENRDEVDVHLHYWVLLADAWMKKRRKKDSR